MNNIRVNRLGTLILGVLIVHPDEAVFVENCQCDRSSYRGEEVDPKNWTAR